MKPFGHDQLFNLLLVLQLTINTMEIRNKQKDLDEQQ